jgi:hypothetical protein
MENGTLLKGWHYFYLLLKCKSPSQPRSEAVSGLPKDSLD